MAAVLKDHLAGRWVGVAGRGTSQEAAAVIWARGNKSLGYDGGGGNGQEGMHSRGTCERSTAKTRW